MHRFWPVFKEFTEIKFGGSPADDLLLFECSMQEEAQEKSFYAGFIRQFSLYSDGSVEAYLSALESLPVFEAIAVMVPQKVEF